MRPPANRKEDHMLKKIIVTSSLALGFFVSFQAGNLGAVSEAAGPVTRATIIAGIDDCNPHCSPQDHIGCPQRCD
jgi:hypothetical protein